MQIDLFADLEVARANGTGCSAPIGRLGDRRRSPHRHRVRPPSTAVVLRSLRADIVDELGALAHAGVCTPTSRMRLGTVITCEIYTEAKPARPRARHRLPAGIPTAPHAR
jgi:hypothetical protein